jgi:hypothetical protein
MSCPLCNQTVSNILHKKVDYELEYYINNMKADKKEMLEITDFFN